MYVVVAGGVTVVDPFAANDPNPAICTEVALVVVQLRVDEAPCSILLGLAFNAIVGGGGAEFVTVTSAEALALPPGPAAVAV